MTRPRLLDLFCKAGGASMGYHRAGFDVTGVDIEPQKHYPFTFIQGDALEYVAAHGHEYDAIAASPPCQAFTALRAMHNARSHPDLLTPTRDALRRIGLPYVIENVVGAPLIDPIRLCGTAFGLGVVAGGGWRELRRHRLFEATFPMLVPPCQHRGATIGIYGDHARDRQRQRAGGQRGVDFPDRDKIVLAQTALGMPWVPSWRHLSQAIPPAYTEFIGKQLLAHLAYREAA